jgi:hypothetical protein
MMKLWKHLLNSFNETNSMHYKTSLLLFILILMTPQLIFAQGDTHQDESHTSNQMEETSPINNSIYSIEGGENTELPILKDSHLNLPFSSNDIFDEAISSTDKSISSNEPMQRFKGNSTPAKNHSQHEKQHVEEATHQLVSFDAKGYKVAIGVTIFSGLIFIGLSLFRVGEGNEKKIS